MRAISDYLKEYKMEMCGTYTCVNCDRDASEYVLIYDSGFVGYVCSCGYEEWVSTTPEINNTRRCPICDSYVDVEDEQRHNMVICKDEGCEQTAHKACTCWECDWYCAKHGIEYYECTSCGLHHDIDGIVTFENEFVEDWGIICGSCFRAENEEVEEASGPYSERGKLRDDNSMYLAHFVRAREEMNDEKCCNQVIQIINEQKLEARPTGYYKTYTGSQERHDSSLAVCFTEGNPKALYDHSDYYSKYGIAFSKFNLMKNHQAAPAIYIPGVLIVEVRDILPLPLVPYVNMIEPGKCDYHHEREWRVPRDISFTHNQIAHLYAPRSSQARIRNETRFRGPIYDLEELQGNESI
jgi:hypothetical protein